MSAVPKLAVLSASEPLEAIIEVINRDGGVIVKDLISPELLAQLNEKMEPQFGSRTTWSSKETHGELGDSFFPAGSVRVYGLMAKVPDQLVEIMRNKIWKGIMDHYLSDSFSSYVGDEIVSQKSGYMLASTAGMRLVPGAKPQPLHRDQIAYLVSPNPKNPYFTPLLGCLIAGSDCTKKNGATLVIPGSHLWPESRAPKREECTYAEMAPGSALFTLGSTYHGAGENVCEKTDPDAIRTLYAVFAQRDYYRADQDEVLTTPLDIAARLPEDILKVAGYHKAVSGVGYVEDHEHPLAYLKEGSPFGKMGPASTKVAV